MNSDLIFYKLAKRVMRYLPRDMRIVDLEEIRKGAAITIFGLSENYSGYFVATLTQKVLRIQGEFGFFETNFATLCSADLPLISEKPQVVFRPPAHWMIDEATLNFTDQTTCRVHMAIGFNGMRTIGVWSMIAGFASELRLGSDAE